MSTKNRDFFREFINNEKMLRSHGFDGWPNDEELVRYACDLEDGLHTLAEAFGVELTKDARGRWRVISRQKGVM